MRGRPIRSRRRQSWAAHTDPVLLKLIAGATALGVLMSGCGHSDYKYRSAEDIAAAIGCDATSTPEPHPAHGYILETCHFHTHLTAIYEMEGNETSHLVMPWARCEVTGMRWEVAGSRVADCALVQSRIGGVVVPITATSTG